ncbi:MAG: methionine--tRNA ligase subunit beta, partial [Christensenellaceae bacterium]|nr:methionine--tRNA ligase subunit beta [Christensenellaceae bacterium]
AECARIIAVLIAPFMPKTPGRIFEQLGISDESLQDFDSARRFGGLRPGTKVKKGEALFPRIDIAKELEAIAPKKAEGVPKPEEGAKKAEITIDEFFKTELRVAKVLSAEVVKGSDKLLKIQLKLGQEERTVVSGIAKSYTPESIVGRKVILVANLKPAKLRGIESNGMLLCASQGEKLTLLTVSEDIADGAEVS